MCEDQSGSGSCWWFADPQGCRGISRADRNTGPAGSLICCVFIRGTLLDNIRAPYWLLQAGWKIRRFVLLYHFFSTAYYARVNRPESLTTREGFEQIARSQRVYKYFEQVKFPPNTELYIETEKVGTFREFESCAEVYLFAVHCWKIEDNLHHICGIHHRLDRCIDSERMSNVICAFVYHLKLIVQKG